MGSCTSPPLDPVSTHGTGLQQRQTILKVYVSTLTHVTRAFPSLSPAQLFVHVCARSATALLLLCLEALEFFVPFGMKTLQQETDHIFQ